MKLRRTHHDPAAIEVPGPSLAKAPALIVGSILVAFGLIGLLYDAAFPTDTAPDGTVQGETFLGFEVNGWTCFFSITAGSLLLFGAAQHLLAKTMSLLVGLALGACAVIATWDGEDVFGLAAANVWTKVGWGAAAVVLLFNTLAPRRTKAVPAPAATTAAPAPAPARPPATAPEPPAVARSGDGRFGREPEPVPDTKAPERPAVRSTRHEP